MNEKTTDTRIRALESLHQLAGAMVPDGLREELADKVVGGAKAELIDEGESARVVVDGRDIGSASPKSGVYRVLREAMLSETARSTGGYRKLVALDFDGVLHGYESGWKGASTIPDRPVPGAMEFLKALHDDGRFRTVVVSSRLKDFDGLEAVRRWLEGELDAAFGAREGTEIFLSLDFSKVRPPAHVTIDDRGIQFTGVWPDLDAIAAFNPWNKRWKIDLENSNLAVVVDAPGGLGGQPVMSLAALRELDPGALLPLLAPIVQASVARTAPLDWLDETAIRNRTTAQLLASCAEIVRSLGREEHRVLLNTVGAEVDRLAPEMTIQDAETRMWKASDAAQALFDELDGRPTVDGVPCLTPDEVGENLARLREAGSADPAIAADVKRYVASERLAEAKARLARLESDRRRGLPVSADEISAARLAHVKAEVLVLEEKTGTPEDAVPERISDLARDAISDLLSGGTATIVPRRIGVNDGHEWEVTFLNRRLRMPEIAFLGCRTLDDAKLVALRYMNAFLDGRRLGQAEARTPAVNPASTSLGGVSIQLDAAGRPKAIRRTFHLEPEILEDDERRALINVFCDAADEVRRKLLAPLKPEHEEGDPEKLWTRKLEHYALLHGGQASFESLKAHVTEVERIILDEIPGTRVHRQYRGRTGWKIGRWALWLEHALSMPEHAIRGFVRDLAEAERAGALTPADPAVVEKTIEAGRAD
ncbi:hypothetical protein GCM10011390_02580 [Aureimonas endophytica]|uniref:Uncharacterized protein n=1 Tax=Aureimonas endophytica TaxID=2027858 RepID=A0A916ZD40_9HYPH|nr:hypothetical protein [Aureimonas endophytica]GGD87350.1 hypothetical protein GCM10011390_02580 [Aureimonas endophytica]